MNAPHDDLYRLALSDGRTLLELRPWVERGLTIGQLCAVVRIEKVCLACPSVEDTEKAPAS